MRTIIISILIFFYSIFAFSQEQKSLECIDRTYSVVVHIVKDTFGTTNFDISKLTTSIQYLNTAFSPICVNFNICDVRYISNYNFDDWELAKNDYEAACLYSEPKHINLFFVQKITSFEGNGFATQNGIVTSWKNIIVLNKNFILSNIVHYFGHYFGLLDTFELDEKVDGSNCTSSGDKICDTPADPPRGTLNNHTCDYVDNVVDVNGQYYKPLVENFMSNYGDCRKSFTHQQYEQMIKTIKINPTSHF